MTILFVNSNDTVYSYPCRRQLQWYMIINAVCLCVCLFSARYLKNRCS